MIASASGGCGEDSGRNGETVQRGANQQSLRPAVMLSDAMTGFTGDEETGRFFF
jgi:hypothetical protein